jgi:acetyl esterase/lipase
MHGGGWVLGNADTHDWLVRELAVGTGAAVAFVEYDRSPEALLGRVLKVEAAMSVKLRGAACS